MPVETLTADKQLYQPVTETGGGVHLEPVERTSNHQVPVLDMRAKVAELADAIHLATMIEFDGFHSKERPSPEDFHRHKEACGNVGRIREEIIAAFAASENDTAQWFGKYAVEAYAKRHPDETPAPPAYDPGPPDCPHGYWKAHCAICLKVVPEERCEHDVWKGDHCYRCAEKTDEDEARGVALSDAMREERGLPPLGPQSRSVQRRVAAQKGEPAPEFGPPETKPLPCCGGYVENGLHWHQPTCIKVRDAKPGGIMQAPPRFGEHSCVKAGCESQAIPLSNYCAPHQPQPTVRRR